MSKAKILYVSQEINPFMPKTEISEMSLNLPKKMKDSGHEVRVFMPRYGKINERRHQLHEVIRLSGINLIINDTDHPLIIKVASIPTARMQVYFIDNEEYFKRKAYMTDEEGNYFPDSDERAMFFARGVLETVKKLQWKPDIIHCHGWMAALMPLYLKEIYHDDPHFQDVRVVYSSFGEGFTGNLADNLEEKLVLDGISKEATANLNGSDYTNFSKVALEHCDGAVIASPEMDSDLADALSNLDKPVLSYQDPEDFAGAYHDFYNEVLEKKTDLVEN